MQTVSMPDDPRDPAALADWLELSALAAADKDASTGDLERELDRLNVSGRDQLLSSVLIEIDKRERGTGQDAYPFERGDTSIEVKANPHEFPAYMFCLALSYLGWTNRPRAPHNPWLLFEELACHAAKSYVGGESLLFGTSSRTGTRGKGQFKQRVTELAKALGEGSGFKEQPTFSTKDSKLDVVAWKPHRDKRASQIILFGQCAAGRNWKEGKLTELDPEGFWDQWMDRGKVSAPLRSVFVPHRVYDDEQWDGYARKARLLFDRCRVVAAAHVHTRTGALADKLIACCRTEWSLDI